MINLSIDAFRVRSPDQRLKTDPLIADPQCLGKGASVLGGGKGIDEYQFLFLDQDIITKI